MIFSTKNLKKHFGGVKALNGVSIEVKKGNIYALIGPNGSGKSTLFHAIFNLIEKEGTVTFEGRDLSKKHDFEIANEGLSRTFQEVRLFKNLTVEQHMLIAMSEQDESLLKGWKEHIDKKRMKDILDLVGFNNTLDTLAVNLSYGQRKLLDLAIAIAKPHTILFLDEPVAGVNPKLRKEIKEVLRKLKDQGETLVIIEHDMNFVMDLADHVIVMDQGKVLTEGTPKTIQNNKKVLEAYLGG